MSFRCKKCNGGFYVKLKAKGHSGFQWMFVWSYVVVFLSVLSNVVVEMF